MQTKGDDNELRKRIGDDAFRILKEKGTEFPFTGKYVHHHEHGMYNCIVCGQQLFASDAKFESGSGWPSFDQALPGTTKLIEDTSHGMHRTEVVCSKCGAHLGHVFDDGPRETTGQRFCINSCALDFDKK